MEIISGDLLVPYLDESFAGQRRTIEKSFKKSKQSGSQGASWKLIKCKDNIIRSRSSMLVNEIISFTTTIKETYSVLIQKEIAALSKLKYPII